MTSSVIDISWIHNRNVPDLIHSRILLSSRITPASTSLCLQGQLQQYHCICRIIPRSRIYLIHDKQDPPKTSLCKVNGCIRLPASYFRDVLEASSIRPPLCETDSRIKDCLTEIVVTSRLTSTRVWRPTRHPTMSLPNMCGKISKDQG